VLRRLRTLLSLGTIGDLSDGQLLERFTTRDGEPAELAFTALLERHGPMVLSVCRKFLSDPHDAQDAFQATFLVLVQKARRLWIRDSLAPWLYRVAHRVAVRARTSRRQRSVHERRAAAGRPAFFERTLDCRDREDALHEEIDRLPEKYAVAVVLCYLEGVSHERAARILDLPVATVKSRLRRARELLRGRLARRGLAFSGGLVLADTGSKAAGAALPVALVDSTVRAAVAALMGQAAALEVISASTAQLTEEVIKTMFLTKLKIIPVALFVVCALAAGAAGVLAQHGSARQRPAENREPRGPTSESAGAPLAGDFEPAPSFIKQSRVMIITRLEEERRLAQAKLDRTLQRVRSENDPEVARARRTVESLEQLIARIDTVLVEAVDRYPTIFDFSGGPAEGTSEATAARPKSNVGAREDPQGDWSDRTELGRAQYWSQRWHDQGFAGRPQFDLELERYKAATARAQADVARAADRLDWTKRMLEKGYITKNAHESAVLEHQAALAVLARWKKVMTRLDELKPGLRPSHRPDAQPAKQNAPPQSDQNARGRNQNQLDWPADSDSTASPDSRQQKQPPKNNLEGQDGSQKQAQQQRQPDQQSAQSGSNPTQQKVPGSANKAGSSQSAEPGGKQQSSKSKDSAKSGGDSNNGSQ
jgi:RNA polymerase sigma factor (sigma-70 family)